MRSLCELTRDQLTEAHGVAGKLISETFRSYLPGRMLPLLLSRYRDDVTQALGMALPPLPQRSGSVRAVKLDDLTTGELNEVSEAALILITRYANTMDDPELPKLLRDFRDALVIEKADRAHIAEELAQKARAS